ncbi:cell cycle progression protein 1 isoform X1 [Zootoca vivipara]|uniref:cell cycle progression protein 1 isoform X1 n=1 Tax=Zootoca vivipara TaxID=8524 RepID=UPI001590ECD4|nr:cell cycle progression protein 1 isoform X1 [Zootoca vivipara]XP_060138818.1 cell cycle progression protein 1 isoform X1 [Zootoca vivipara]XP_060138819.1 cell cycle progression protein 1 isoform X1 [Zootoca vivipara]XP_060138820.1 cell cycle progression protein 1 isoform X1 [Zootoca vivipara]
MSENSSDSDSSCGWTVINHEGSDVEAVASEYEALSGHVEPALDESPSLAQGDDEQEQPIDLQTEFGQADVSSMVVQSHFTSEATKPVPEDEKEKVTDESSCVGAISDDSDIVTLETPKVEEIGSPEEEEAVPADQAVPAPEVFNMGSSSSSQYTFCQPETASWLEKLRKIPECISGWVFLPHPSGEESSSDETSNRSSPTLRRRRAKKRLVSSSESEDVPPLEQETEQAKEHSHKHQFSSGLNRCIILALVIAVSMGFGHFYDKRENFLFQGTVQIQERQQLVEKTHEDELNGIKDNLIQCQQEQGMKAECKSLKEGLEMCLHTTEVEKKSFESQKHHLASENQHLRESLEREEKALALLQEELRKLREQIRHLENKGSGPELVATENQKLKAHLEEERHRVQSFVKQKETLLAEAQMLRRELDKERQLTVALREELDKLSSQQASPEGAGAGDESQEIEALRGRLTALEEKLSFEQQRSDLWEKLYVEVKDHVEKKEQTERPQKPDGKGTNKAKRKPKGTFFGSVKETFDAMKNSTKEFVRHHKEKIKQAKEAVKENLRKFSDSVKSTFRHFKDTTKNIFDEREKKKYSDSRHEANKKGKTGSSQEGLHKPEAHRSPGSQREFRDGRRSKESRSPPHFPKDPPFQECPKGNRKHRPLVLKGCSGIFDCAHQEFVNLFDKDLDPIRADEFNQLMHKYLQQEVKNFHHWRELEIFVNRFFRNGVFIHDQMLFTDFVNDVKDYLEDIKEYQRNSDGVFEDLDKYIYRYYFHYDHLPQHRPSHPARRAPFTHPHSPQQDRHAAKHQHRYKREGRWHKQGRSNGRHMANLEIELGQMPFDPKY